MSLNTTINTNQDQWIYGKPIDFQEMKDISQQQTQDSDIVIFDVREVADYAAGHIPNALHLPLTVFEASLAMDQDVFARTYRFSKPAPEQKVVLYCRSGRRSGLAADIARGCGYKRVREYKGSWNEWSAKMAEQGDDAAAQTKQTSQAN
ncbi:hypothetical protein OIO90_004930 [Microbotryomycetes sp. JL221]|nr:hypothetical protein OIO90_004930 [Microbotryomycetes sp. JL221]